MTPRTIAISKRSKATATPMAAVVPDAGGGGGAADGSTVFEDRAAADEADPTQETLKDARLGVRIGEGDLASDQEVPAARDGHEGEGSKADAVS
jgi:hypothetical protein